MLNKKNFLLWSYALLVVLMVFTFFINKGMFSAFLLLIILLYSTFFVLKKYNILTKNLKTILLISFILHFILVILIYNFDIRPFGGGADYEGYQKIAQQTSENFRMGNFSLDGAHYGHDFTVVIAVIYYIFGSDPLVGRFLLVWFFIMAVLFAYMVIREIGGSEKKAFLIGLFLNFYPSYAYFGSILLKDTIVIPLLLFGVFLIIKLVRRFSLMNFIIFFFITMAVSHLRFYVGYALILTFIITWFVYCLPNYKRKIFLGLILTLLIGYSPFAIGQGYFGLNSFTEFLNQEKITQYREISYNPNAKVQELDNPNAKVQELDNPNAKVQELDNPNAIAQEADNFDAEYGTQIIVNEKQVNGTGSSFVVKTGLNQGILSFTVNSMKSFIYAAVGPFPWQLKNKRQMVSLMETVPWYLLLIVFVYSLTKFIKREKLSGLAKFLKDTAPLWSFAILALGALSLFINNYGIISRIKIPIFIFLIIAMSLLIKEENLPNFLKIKLNNKKV